MRRAWGPWSRGIYPHGFVWGVLMCVCAYPMQHWDVPVPVVVVICFAPAFVVSGFLVARRHGSEQGVAAGAAAMATGYGVVFLTTASYAAVNQSELAGLGWALFGLAFLPVALMYGVLCGCAGAGIARSLRFLADHGR